MNRVVNWRVFALFFFVLCGFGQVRAQDSLLKLPSTLEGIRRIDVLNKLSEQQQGINAEKSLLYAREAMRLAIDQKDDARLAVSTINVGVVYRNVGQTGKALETFIDALALAERVGNKAIEADALHKIGVTYLFVNEYEDALEYGIREEKIWLHLKDSTGLANTYNFLGLIYLNQNRMAEASETLNRSMELARKLGDKNLLYKPLVNLADLHIRAGNGDKAVETVRESLSISGALGNTFGEAVGFQKLGVALRMQGKFQESDAALRTALAKAQQIKSLSLVRNTYRDLANLYDEMADYKQTLDFYRQYIALEDSIFNQLTRRKVAETTSRYEIEKKEAENERLKLEARKSAAQFKISVGVVVIIAVLSTFLLIMYRRQRKTVNEMRILNSRIMALNAEVQQQKNEVQEQNLQLSEVNIKKDRFFSIFAHDVRASFTGIMGFSEALTQDIDVISKEDAADMARRILQSARAVNGLFENLLHWSRLELNEIAPMPAKVRLDQMMKSLTDIFRLNAEQKGILLSSDIPEGMEVTADEYILSTILRNVISNAIKFTKEGDRVFFNAWKEQSQTIIEVVDEGIGIPESLLNGLFTIGARTSRPGTGHEKGTGLGLHVCQRLAEKAGALLEISSSEGRGTTVRIVLP